MIRFTDPLWLLLLIPLVVGLALAYPRTGGMVRWRKRTAFALRFLLGASLILALSGPEARKANSGVCTIYVVDRSDSIGDAARARQEQYLAQATSRVAAPDATGIVVFGSDARIEVSPAAAPLNPRLLSSISRSGTDVAGAVRLASAMFPDGKARRIVLLTDGNSTQGDLEAAAEVAHGDGTEIDVVPLGVDPKRKEVVVLGLETPSVANRRQPIELRATIGSNVATDALVELDADGVVLSRQNVRLAPGENAIVLPARSGEPGFRRYRVTVRATGDSDGRNNVGAGFVRVTGPSKILVVNGDEARSSLATALREAGISVNEVGPANLPTRAEGWIDYDAIFLNDVNALAFTPTQMAAVTAAAKDSGVGLAMVGGENSFLPGGWYGSPVAEALPVSLDIKQRKSYAAASVAIIVDASGSMGAVQDGQQKIRLAAKAAEETAKLLGPQDRIAVAGSSDGIDWVVKMQPTSSMTDIVNGIRRLDVTGGGIYIRPSIAAGRDILMNEASKTRHLIMLCDGGDSTDQEGAIQTALFLRANKITTTVVAIGEGKDVPFLRQLAAAGGGRFFLTERASQLPAIFTQDAAVMTRAAIEEGAFTPKLVGIEPMLRGAPLQGTPPLLAYDLSSDRPLARTALRTAKDDPLLAIWQYGLGQTMAFTSDAKPRWARGWIGWPGYGAFWSQAARQIARKAAQGTYEVAATQEGGRGKIVLRATDRLGNPVDGMSAKLRLSAPDGTGREITPDQTGPGRYEAEFDAATLGSYIVSVAERGPGGETRVASSGFAVPYPPEYRLTKPNRLLLERIAKRTGGLVDPAPERTMRPALRPGGSVQPLWPLLLTIAPILLLMDVAIRRLALRLRDLTGGFRRESKGAAVEANLGRLRAARDTVRAPKPTVPSPPSRVAPRASLTPEGEAEERPGEPSAEAGTTGQLLASRRRRERDG